MTDSPDQKREKQRSKVLTSARNIQTAAQDVYNRDDNQFASFPRFLTGARCYIVVAGKPYALAQRVSYSINANVEEYRGIDSNLPYELATNQITVRCSLSSIVDPDMPGESDSVWATMASILHQPLVELEIYDKLGEKLFSTKGMFTSISETIAIGAVAERSLEFVGMTYVHNVAQSFRPYSPTTKFTNKVKSDAKNIAKVTGGIL